MGKRVKVQLNEQTISNPADLMDQMIWNRNDSQFCDECRTYARERGWDFDRFIPDRTMSKTTVVTLTIVLGLVAAVLIKVAFS